MLTADTITNKQIRDIMDRAGSLDGDEDFIRETCKRALIARKRISSDGRRRARARIAAIVNALTPERR